MLEALVGFVGVVVGGLLAGGVAYWADQRETRARATVGLRLVEGELVDTAARLDAARIRDRWVTSVHRPTTEQWVEQRAALVPVLTRDEWLEVLVAFVQADSISKALGELAEEAGGRVDPLDQQARSLLDQAIGRLERARQIVARHAIGPASASDSAHGPAPPPGDAAESLSAPS